MVSLTPQEARATAVAAARFKPGSARYQGCRAGFLDAFPGGDSRLAALDRSDPEIMHGYHVGLDLGHFARSQEARHTLERI